MYSSPVLSTISILVLIYTTYLFFHHLHTCFNMIFHAADIQGVSFPIIIPVKKVESFTDKSREGENRSTVLL